MLKTLDFPTFKYYEIKLSIFLKKMVKKTG